jgi:hypothetical protein
VRVCVLRRRHRRGLHFPRGDLLLLKLGLNRQLALQAAHLGGGPRVGLGRGRFRRLASRPQLVQFGGLPGRRRERVPRRLLLLLLLLL